MKYHIQLCVKGRWKRIASFNSRYDRDHFMRVALYTSVLIRPAYTEEKKMIRVKFDIKRFNKAFAKIRKRIKAYKRYARTFLYKAGIITKKGKLRQCYRRIIE